MTTTSSGPAASPTASQSASIGVAMFTVSDQDAAVAFYRDRLGWEVRSDTPVGPDGEWRWVEVAPAGSAARLALNPPMGGQPGGSAIGLEVADVRAEHERLSAVGGLEPSPVMDMPGAPTMFSVQDPDGNSVWITATEG